MRAKDRLRPRILPRLLRASHGLLFGARASVFNQSYSKFHRLPPAATARPSLGSDRRATHHRPQPPPLPTTAPPSLCRARRARCRPAPHRLRAPSAPVPGSVPPSATTRKREGISNPRSSFAGPRLAVSPIQPCPPPLAFVAPHLLHRKSPVLVILDLCRLGDQRLGMRHCQARILTLSATGRTIAAIFWVAASPALSLSKESTTARPSTNSASP